MCSHSLLARTQSGDSVPDISAFACWASNALGERVSVSAALLHMTSLPESALLLRGWTEYIFAQDKDMVLARVDAAVALRQGYQLRYRWQRQDGTPLWVLEQAQPRFDSDGQFLGYDGVLLDVHELMVAEVDLAYYQANFDAMTGLPNRNLLRDRLQQTVASAKRHHCLIAVLLLHVDGFKRVNDSLGRPSGDRLLQSISARLRHTLRTADTVARSDGNEFAVVLTELEREDGIALLAERVRDCFNAPFKIDGHELFVNCSVGVSCFPKDGHSADALLESASIALHRTKNEGAGRLGFFSQHMFDQAQEQLLLEARLRRALEHGEFKLHYQPQVDFTTGQICGAEALIRWHHPELGLVAPGKFIPTAEASHLILPIGEWVLRAACHQAVEWLKLGLPLRSIAVNLSAQQLRQRDLLGMIQDALAESGLDGSNLELELTESMIIERPEQVIALLKELEGLGIKLAVDDFGTGYSSLTYLKRLPLHKVKIDQSFVRDVEADADSAAIARAIISVAHDMRKRVIAEGVETVAQARFLRDHGCDELQGFLFSRPLPVDEMTELLRSGACLSLSDLK